MLQSEALLHLAWAHRLYASLESTHRIEVIDPGVYNEHAGADFHNAKIKIDGILWAGDVELHLYSRGWYEHGHNEDPAYTSVVLHVVAEGDEQAVDYRGRAIPTAYLRPTDELLALGREVSSRPNYCHTLGDLESHLSQIDYADWSRLLALERLDERSAYWQEVYTRQGCDYTELFHQLLFRYFGFGLNNDAMERLARSIPARVLIKQGDSLLHLEAILLGQAGLLHTLPTEEPYVQLLVREYAFLAHKYGLTRLPEGIFRWAKTRPPSFPLRRLLQLARLLYHTRFLADKTLRVTGIDELLALLRYEDNPSFWQSYLRGRSATSLCLSVESCMSIGINVVAVYQYTLACLRPDWAHLREQAITLCSSLPAERNSIVERLGRAGFAASDAMQSQALLQLYRGYCQQRKCLYCRLGRRLLVRYGSVSVSI